MSHNAHPQPHDAADPDRGELFALDPLRPAFADGALPHDDPLRAMAEVPLADDQDPTLPTDAGLVAHAHTRLLERAYIGEEMARIAWAARFDAMLADDRDAALMHQGAAEALAALAYTLPAVATVATVATWRGPARLDRVAARVLLGRAKRRLSEHPEDADAGLLLHAAREALDRPAADPR